MELKKNPTQDIHRKSGMFFQIGLGISIALVITAFEWRTPLAKAQPRLSEPCDNSIILVPLTEFKKPEPPLPTLDKNDVVSHKGFTPISTETTTVERAEPAEPSIDPSLLSSVEVQIVVDSAENCPDCFIVIAEKQPEPINGYAGFYELIRTNLKYPKRARQMEVEGKVFVEFIVNRDGLPSDIKILKGIGAGCDEEAMRVIALTKWNPGKQRGKPVRVKMVMPMHFRIN